MRILVTLLVLIVFNSCATKINKPVNKKISEITNEDFKPTSQIKYSKSNDVFNSIDSEYSQALNSESLERVYRYGGSVKLDGPLGKIVNACYRSKFKDAKNLIRIHNRKFLKNPVFWNQVGTCYLLMKKRRKALLFFNKALSAKQNYGPALNNLGVMYMREKDYSRALVAFRRANKSSDFNKTPRFNLANLYLNFGLYDRAIAEAQNLISDESKDVDVLNILANSFLMKGKYQRAKKYFDRIDSDYLSKIRFGLNYALNEYYLGNLDGSRDAFSDINEKPSKEWTSYYSKVKKLLGVSK